MDPLGGLCMEQWHEQLSLEKRPAKQHAKLTKKEADKLKKQTKNDQNVLK